MPISKDSCKAIDEEYNTPGGVTYHVTLKGERQSVALCFRRLTNGSGDRCANVAGKGTWHVGTGACKNHGGNAGRKPSHGRYAVRARERLADDIQEYLDGDRNVLLNLDTELATLRALFAEFLEQFPEPTSDSYGIELHRIQQLVGTIGTLVEKITKVEARNTLTMAQVLYLRATVADLFLKYISDPAHREQAIQELTFRIGGQGMLSSGTG